jgi:L-rhamnose isomerase
MNPSPYSIAQETFAAIGVDTEAALTTLQATPISMHCWQGDDVGGFERAGDLTGGIQVTGNYPGKARTLDELRKDFTFAQSLIPGTKRLNLHAIYGDFTDGVADRDAIEYKHFASWVDYCRELGIGIDYNPTCFSHEKSADGFTLSHPDDGIRAFWVEHCKRARRIAAKIGQELQNPVVTNVWIPDGFKDTPVDRKGYRQRLESSLDAVFAEDLGGDNIDAVECKLFGIGSESCVIGSHEFYLGYAVKNQKWLCLDMGHFHPTEQIADKLSSVQQFVPGALLHVSRGVRWDSDHVVLCDDQTTAVMEELVRGNLLATTRIGLDFFDASINRIAAWVIGTRAAQRSLLKALLEPVATLKQYEREGDYTSRLAILEEVKNLPWGLVWDEFCRRSNVPVGAEWLKEVKTYEAQVLSKR